MRERERERESVVPERKKYTEEQEEVEQRAQKLPRISYSPPVFINTPPGALLLPVHVFIAPTNITSGSLQKNSRCCNVISEKEKEKEKKNPIGYDPSPFLNVFSTRVQSAGDPHPNERQVGLEEPSKVLWLVRAIHGSR